MAINQFLPFCENDTGTNLLTQEQYEDDTQRPIGNQPGVARSKLVNKVLRQCSFIGAAMAQAIANITDQDVLDDGDIDNLANLFTQGITQVSSPIGVPIPYLGATAPTGYAFLFGQAISRTGNPLLWDMFGTTYGAGDGSTTFNLPDWRGRIPLGKDNMGGTAAGVVTVAGSGVPSTTLGAVGGHQLTQAHTHANTLTDPGHTHATNLVAGQLMNPGGSDAARNPGTGGQTTSSNQTGITLTNVSYGGGNAQNMPPVIVCNWMIRLA